MLAKSSSRRAIVVTGASRGIGAAVVAQLLEASPDVHVVAIARTPAAASSAMAKHHHHDRLTYIEGDVTDAHVRRAAIDAAVAAAGRVDAVVNNAATLAPMARIADVAIDELRHSLDVNLVAAVALVQDALPHLRSARGAVINVSSGAATTAYQGWLAYCCAKSALNMFTATLAKEEPDVTAICVRPGVVDTQMQDTIRAQGQQAMGSDFNKFPQLHRNGDLLPPEKPAQAIARLALAAPKELSGQFLAWNEVTL